jgi:acyl-homoserine lactone synthase
MSVIHIVTPENEHHYLDAMDQAYRLRHCVFVEQKGWQALAKPDGREIDQFDDKHAVHMLCIKRGKVLGYQRMLPTTRPHLLSDVLPELCEVERPVGAHIWEISRHCVAAGHRSGERVDCAVVNDLALGLVEWGIACGISNFIVEIEPMSLLPLINLNFQPLPLGLPHKIDGQDVMAVILSFDERTLARVHEMRGSRRKILVETSHRPHLLHG